MPLQGNRLTAISGKAKRGLTLFCAYAQARSVLDLRFAENQHVARASG